MSLEDIPYVDIFTPSSKEFSNFEKYMEECEKKSKSGIFKVKIL